MSLNQKGGSFMQIKQIISGGQTGADMGGLLAGEFLGIPTGGFAAAGFRTELGNKPELGTRFNLEDTRVYNYLHRTALNVHRSDGTALFGNCHEGGTLRTRQFCVKYKKPHFLVVDYERINYFRTWILVTNVQVLNVAGNRESVFPGLEQIVFRSLVEALKEWNDVDRG